MAQAKPGKKPTPPTPARANLLFMARVSGAKEVLLAGDFSEWAEAAISLHKGPKDEWRTTLELEPGEYQYRLLVDGEWQNDPQAVKRVSNAFGSENCVFVVPGVANITSRR